ncbi:MAG: hypothetical protein KBD78_07700 [Oligoflexales bacterium]|nr:hypothetical protein [Oligoflexales bacterium]
MKWTILKIFIFRSNLWLIVLCNIFYFGKFSIANAVTNINGISKSTTKPTSRINSFTLIQASESSEICDKAFDRLYMPLKEIFKSISKTEVQLNRDFLFKNSDCKSFEKRQEFISKLNQVISHHNESIVLIVQSGLDPYYVQIKNGFESILKLKKFRHLKYKIIEVEAQPSETQLKQIFFKNYYNDKASIFFLAHSEEINQKFYTLGRPFKTPIIFLTESKIDRKDKIYSLQPRQEKLAKYLADLASKKFKKIGILATTSSFQSDFTQNFIAEIRLHGVNIEAQSFNPENFNSLNSAISLFIKRKNLKEISELNGEKVPPTKPGQEVPVNSSEDIFEPNIEALFLPDDFKIVHHVLRILDYYGIKNISLLGSPKWRSPGIIQSKHLLLNGALIVDYIGRKQSLPNHLRNMITDLEDDVFFNPDTLVKAEGYLLGIKAGLLASKFDLSSKISRLSLLSNFKTEQGDNIDTVLGQQWPEIIFEIRNGKGSLFSSGLPIPAGRQ